VKYLALSFCALLALSGCAHKKAKDPQITALPAPISPMAEQSRKAAALHAEGVDMLYSKDPRVKNSKKAFEKLTEAATLGDAPSMDLVGGFYATGMAGVEKSCSKAMNWYEKSAEAGYPLAFNNLAYMLVTCEDKLLRDADRAESIMKFMFQNQPNIVALLDTYATVLAEQRDFKQATQTMETVIDIQKFMDDNPERIDQAQQALDLFKKNKKLSVSFEAGPTSTGAKKKIKN
jgi:TPR repeat protein